MYVSSAQSNKIVRSVQRDHIWLLQQQRQHQQQQQQRPSVCQWQCVVVYLQMDSYHNHKRLFLLTH